MAVRGSDQHDVSLEPAAHTQEITEHNVHVRAHAVAAAVVLHHRRPHRVHLNRNHVTAGAAEMHGNAADAGSSINDDAAGAGGGVVRADLFGGHHEIAGDVAVYAGGGGGGAGRGWWRCGWSVAAVARKS